jgi:hypothetical protein
MEEMLVGDCWAAIEQVHNHLSILSKRKVHKVLWLEKIRQG